VGTLSFLVELLAELRRHLAHLRTLRPSREVVHSFGGEIERFASVGNFVSYCRLVQSQVIPRSLWHLIWPTERDIQLAPPVLLLNSSGGFSDDHSGEQCSAQLRDLLSYVDVREKRIALRNCRANR
jgi:hypothetical protein